MAQRYAALRELSKQNKITLGELDEAASMLDKSDADLGEQDRLKRDAYVELAGGKIDVGGFRSRLNEVEAARWRRVSEHFQARAKDLPSPLQDFGRRLIDNPNPSASQRRQRDILADFSEGQIGTSDLPASLAAAQDASERKSMAGRLLDQAEIDLGAGSESNANLEVQMAGVFDPANTRTQGIIATIRTRAQNRKQAEQLTADARALRGENPEQAAALLTKALALNPANAEAKSLLKAVNGDVAAGKAQQEIDADINRAQAEDQTGAYQDALASLAAADVLRPGLARVSSLQLSIKKHIAQAEQVKLADAQWRNGDGSGALTALNRILAESPGLSGAVDLKTRITADLRRVAQVKQLLIDARKLRQIGDIQGALDQLMALRKLDANNGDAEAVRQEIAKQLVFVHNEAERQRQADSFLQRGWELECDRNFAAALGSYGIVRAMYPSREDARASIERVARALKIQTSLQTAREDEAAGRFQDALNALQELGQFAPNVSEAAQMKPRLVERIGVQKQLAALMEKATAMETRGDLRGALETCDEALKLDPGFAIARSKKTADSDKISKWRAATLADATRAAAASDYASALKSLDAMVQYGPEPEATALRAKVVASIKADSDKREARLLSLLTNATRLADDGDPQAAVGLLANESDVRAGNLRATLTRRMAAAESECSAADAALAQSRMDDAFKGYHSAATGGSVRAMVSLATLYRLGQGVVADPAEGEKWLGRAAARGDAQAMQTLAIQLRPRDPAAALALFQRAAAAGKTESLLPLAEMYEQGQGVAKSPGQALIYYREAANNGDAIAMIRAADMYEKGTGVSKDLALATEWYQKAARLGNHDAIEWLKRRDTHVKHLLDQPQ
jgi:TPR repeat protein